MLFQKCQNRAKTTPQRATCKVKREKREKREKKRGGGFQPKKEENPKQKEIKKIGWENNALKRKEGRRTLYPLSLCLSSSGGGWKRRAARTNNGCRDETMELSSDSSPRARRRRRRPTGDFCGGFFSFDHRYFFPGTTRKEGGVHTKKMSHKNAVLRGRPWKKREKENDRRGQHRRGKPVRNSGG